MHDIDRVQPAADEFEAESDEFREPGEFEQGGAEPPMHEAQELEFASRLLELSDEQELEQFLGDVFRTVGSAVGRFARSDTGRALGAILKDAVGKALPLMSGAGAGTTGPAAGHGARGDLAQQAASLLGLELEGLSPPEQEFETARQFVRLAGRAYQHAAWAPRNVPPRAAARMAAVRAARRYAPGLLRWADRIGSGYGSGRRPGSPYGYSYAYRPTAGGYPQAGGYRPRTPWRSRWTYPRPPYAWSYGTLPSTAADDDGGYAPDSYGPVAVAEPPPAVAPAVPVDPVPVPAPPPAAAADPAAPAPDAGGSGELSPFGSLDESPHRPGSRGGRWERHGSVLIVYGI